MNPTLFAIFMLCSPDLLTCVDHLEVESFENLHKCQEFIEEMKEHHEGQHEGTSILLGRCVWRIVEE